MKIVNKLSIFIHTCFYTILFTLITTPIGFSQEKNTQIQTAPITLSSVEKEWLNNNIIINVAGYSSLLPHEIFEKNGQYVGIVSDYLNLVSEKLNIKFNFINAENKNKALIQLISGDVDMISTTETTNSELITTKFHQNIPLIIVMKEKNDFIESINDIKHKKIILINNTNYKQEIINNYPDTQFIYKDNIEQALIAISTGEADALISPLSQASYYISNMQLHDLSIVGTTQYSMVLHFAFLPSSTVFRNILDKVLEGITLQEKQVILSQWGKKNVIKKINYTSIISIIVILILIISIFFYWNKRLRIEVEDRKNLVKQTNMLIDHIPQHVIVWDISGYIMTANKKVLLDYQINKNEITSFNAMDFYENLSDRAKVVAAIKEYGHVEEMIIPFKRPNNTVHQMMVSIIPTTYRDKKVFLSIAVDLTERLAMETALEQAKQKAEIANQAKSEFLANMSHEIRTPMNAVIGFTELLQEQITDPKSLSFVKTIKSAGQSLLTLINDILDLSKVEAGQLSIINEATNIHYLFKEIGDIFTLKVKNKNIDLYINVEKNIPESLYLDRTRLRQVLFNIIGNAVKFTEVGEIKITVTIQDSQFDKSLADLHIAVQDSGIGIPEEAQMNIFESFQQQEGQNVRKYGGTGLGLSISKRLIKLMGGRLFVKSRLGEGACFHINLPNIEVSSIDDKNIKTMKDLNSKEVLFNNSTVLIVDDIEDNRNLLKEIFHKLSLNSLMATNGQEAIDMTKNNKIDLILMDIRMPVMDGYQAAQFIKISHPQIPILALTASVMRDDYEKQRRENFLGYLRKPVLQHELINELIKYLPHTFKVKEVKNTTALLHITNNALTDECIKLFSHKCIEIQKSNAMNDINVFAKSLHTWAEEHNEQSLFVFSEDLIHAVDIFDIQEIKILLNTFMSFIGSKHK